MRSRTGDSSTGNGDPCPLVPEHGMMFALKASAGREQRQWCAHVSHDVEGTRSLWPLYDFEAAVAAYVPPVALPELDIEVM